ncbi:hypothetical protein BJ508DRAFT_85144 [Ascobolus immersus RN42]|uniref:Membrane anchor Opy2 N-terminal domain-containing protein n=1 Tax=Ascobolus immersus RN42 TaxID=1160509 RepID=A0A3N4HIJ8_ASCIM|nr:hypothetical protein BJ508DRAFT_85144 [Ascobolus immersus RN42]
MIMSQSGAPQVEAIPPSILFRRDDPPRDASGCIKESYCNSLGIITCENACDTRSWCTLFVRSCDSCPFTQCYPRELDDGTIDSTQASAKRDDGGPNVGGIVGGVLGGVALLGLIAFVLYRRRLKKKKTESLLDEKDEQFGRLRGARASTQTVASMSSSFSNVIQIAYVPGVTSASAPTSPGLTIPTVPRIPEAYRDSQGTMRYPQSPAATDEVFYLMPNRGSTYTARTNRSSVATTIYGGAVQPVPEVVRGRKANVVQVSVKSGPTTPELDGGQIPEVVVSRPGLRVVQVGKSPLSQSSSGSGSRGSIGESYNKNRAQRGHFDGSDSEESAISDSDEPYQHHSRSQAQKGAKDRKSRGSYLSTTDIDDSPFSDTMSETISIDDLPLPPGSGMPPMSVSRLSVQRSAGNSSNSKESLGSRYAASPFDDSHAVKR